MTPQQKDSRYDWIYWIGLVAAFAALGVMLAWRG